MSAAPDDGRFVPSTPLDERIHAGDIDGTLALLRPLDVAARAKHRPALVRMATLMDESRWRGPSTRGWWGPQATDEQQRAVSAALLLCGRAQDMTILLKVDPDLVVAMHREYGVPCLPQLADALLARNPRYIRVVQALIAAGIIERPVGDDYVLGLIELPGCVGRDGSFADELTRDPGLPQALLRLFDVEGGGETSLAAHDKYAKGDASTWSFKLRDLAASGRIGPGVLLDRTLSALERDFAQFRAGWFSRFHDELAPTVDEMRPHAARYLALCRSRIPPTVKLALDALAKLEPTGAVAPDALLAALAPVFAGGGKGHVEAAMKLAERAVARDPALEPAACTAMAAALVLDAVPLQAKLLKRLSRSARHPDVRAALHRHGGGIAASNRAAFDAIADVASGHVAPPPAAGKPVAARHEAAREVAGAVAAAPRIAAAPRLAATPIDDDRALAPVTDLDELVQAIAVAFEQDADADAFERAVAALVAAAPISAADRERFGPIRKRAAKVKKLLPMELARLVRFVIDGERLASEPVQDYFGHRSAIHRTLIARIDDAMDLAASGRGVEPLWAPTHRGGVIAPSAFIDRVRRHHEAGATSPAHVQAAALLRIAGPVSDADRAAARALPDSPFVQALRHALGDDGGPGTSAPLAYAAARVRHPRGDDPVVRAAFGDGGPDTADAARFRWEPHILTFESGREFHQLLVHSPPRGDVPAELPAVARHPRPYGPGKYIGLDLFALAGEDTGLVAWSATTLPGDLEAFFAEGARAVGNNLDWWQARWFDRAYLEPLVDPTAAAGPMAWLLLACCLGAKEPGQAAVAVDALVAMHDDGRLDVAALAEPLRRLLATPLVKPPRYRKAFDAALRLQPALAPALFDLLCAALPLDATPVPADLAKLLELLHELQLATGRALPAATRAGLEALDIGGSGRGLRKKLLATPA